jgi:hypothetical protein
MPRMPAVLLLAALVCFFGPSPVRIINLNVLGSVSFWSTSLDPSFSLKVAEASPVYIDHINSARIWSRALNARNIQ